MAGPCCPVFLKTKQMFRASMEDLAKMRNLVDQGAKAQNRENMASFGKANLIKRCRKKGSEEHHLQVACVKWFRTKYCRLSSLLLSIPNGTKLHNGVRAWKKLEAEGAVAGAPDLLLLIPSGDYGYLCIEMKTKKGRQQDSQKAFEEEIVKNGGAYCICRSIDEFINAVQSYLERGEF